MNTRLAVICVRTILGSAAAACALFAADAGAKDHNVTVAIHVSAGGLDLNRPAGAHTFYARLQNAAWVACTRGNRADLLPVDDLQSCREKALAGAVRSARTPMLTEIYLESHTLREAALQGIEIPAQVAAKYRRERPHLDRGRAARRQERQGPSGAA